MSINSLNQAQFSRIFYYLQDSDLKALGATSKAIHELVAHELKERDVKMQQLLQPSIENPSTSGFVTTRTFNIQHINQARLLAIGDEHGNEDCVRDRSALIGFLSRRAPVIVLIEGVTSMEPIADVFQQKLTTFIGSPAPKMFSWIKSLPKEPAYKANIHALGWDTFYGTEVLGLLFMHKNRILREEESIKQQHIDMLQNQAPHLSSLLPEHLSIPHLWEEFKLDQLESHPVKADQALNFVRNLSKIAEEDTLRQLFISLFIPIFSKRIDSYVNEHLEEIKINQKELFDAYETYRAQLSSYEKETQRLDRNYRELGQQVDQAIKATFVYRTYAMASTLDRVDDYRRVHKIGEHYIVLIAGSHHLEATAKDPEYDLKRFYDELTEHKAAILIPTVIAQDYQGRSSQEQSGST